MGADLDDLIGNAVVDAGLAERDDMGEFTEVVEETPPEPESGEPPVAEGSEEPPAEGVEGTKPAEKEKPAEGDDLDRELQGLGIQPKDAKGGESRIRYSRVRKIWENWNKKLTGDLTEKHGKTVKDLEAKVTANAQKIEYWDNAEKLATNEPRRYLDLLVRANPAYQQFLNPAIFGGSGGAAPAPASEPGEKMPGPDAKFEDGSTGYSPEGLGKVLEWNTARTLKQAKEMFAQQYGKPLENLTTQQRTAAERQMHATRVQQNVARAKELYGQAFADDFGDLGSVKADSQIIKVLNEHPGINFMDACAMALIPKIQGNRNTMREGILKELRERPAGARPSAPEGSKASSAVTPATTEGIIEEQMRKAGML